jgi:DNA-binding MarR family transcriptional regulator
MTFRQRLGMALRGAYLAMHRRFQAHFAPLGVTADQFVVLTLLAEEDGIIQRELVQRTCSDANTMTAILRLLEERGLIRRVPHERDRRARCVYLTDEGRELQRRLFASAEPLHRELREALEPEELTVVLRCLNRISEVMAPPASSEE